MMGVNSQLGDIYLSESIDQLGWKNIEHMSKKVKEV